MLKYCLDRHNTQKMCDEVVDDFLPALKFVTDWFVRGKMLYSQMYSILMKILVISHFLMVKLVFLGEMLIILTLMMLIVMKMILKLLFMSFMS